MTKLSRLSATGLKLLPCVREGTCNLRFFSLKLQIRYFGGFTRINYHSTELEVQHVLALNQWNIKRCHFSDALWLYRDITQTVKLAAWF
uniref:Uncharacterized protein n=1 Tax=Rhizophora mucronata TaxID=61149 RepID=A0A2P2PSN8_RHIMU